VFLMSVSKKSKFDQCSALPEWLALAGIVVSVFLYFSALVVLGRPKLSNIQYGTPFAR
jgi:hypothetical protein